ncbi:hypothetical protein [Echinimonas agarilytica]|uniref:Spermine/spermidine synthase n=1 Tax=Echinimonas agarilytica TaxID=1215918 RepID=A0AA42B8A9_9GAMM|nr:hypothetical protein [Echinimonas agarilytica]MCM2681010.1 hypothetical protein [Echinimonas agarilytica]
MAKNSWQHATRYGNITRLIHQDGQCIKVKENDQYRWLEIDGIMQSLMKLNDPSMPVLPPHQAMLEVLPDASSSGIALELGLGGGAMQRYFTRNLPHWELTSVELNPLIIELYREHFQLDDDSTNRQLLGRAELTVESIDNSSIGALIVDICTDEGIPEVLATPQFWLEINRILEPDAALAVNLIPKHEKEWLQVTDLMRQTLALDLGWIEIPRHLNILVVSTHDS